jgi:drug/metabolite transporter (DMT)-like permease
VSRWWLKDRHVRAEYLASALVVIGVALVVLTG